jgi:predicted TIM-barrel fold metal-dependent hydrolase
MWGTDFPYILQNIGYGKAVDLFHEQMDFLGEDDKEWLFAKTAQSVWRFGGAAPPRN